MSKKIIYLKEVSSYNDILKKEHNKMPLFLKKDIFLYKNIFNIITKKKIEDNEIWILPMKEKHYINRIEKILKKYLINQGNIYVVSDALREQKMCELMDKYNITYITEEKIKKVLLIHILKYIINIQKKEISDLELTILVNDTSNINMYLIEEISKLVKNLKIVSLNIYKFKKLEEKLYNEFGIPIQFSNSYKKSLEKSKIIVNLDFSEIEINEYEIFDKAIIINCINNSIKIKSRLFNGIIINSCNIDFKKEIINKFKKMQIFEQYKKIILYASIIENEIDIQKIFEKLIYDKINIISLIGNSGNINKKEFKNVDKKLDKNKKTE